MIAAGVGNEVTLELGGKTDMPSIGLKGKPLQVRGRVRAITDGEFVITGPMYTGIRTFLGRTAVLDTGRAQIVVTERAHEPMDLGIFTHCGIDPRAQKVHHAQIAHPLPRRLQADCRARRRMRWRRRDQRRPFACIRYRKASARPIWPLDAI